MTEVFRVGGDIVQASVANNVRRLIAEGSGDEDEEEADEEMRLVHDACADYIVGNRLPQVWSSHPPDAHGVGVTGGMLSRCT